MCVHVCVHTKYEHATALYEKYVFPQELVLGVESTLKPMYWCLYSDTVFTDMLSREVLF